jgi:Aspartyl protease
MPVKQSFSKNITNQPQMKLNFQKETSSKNPIISRKILPLPKRHIQSHFPKEIPSFIRDEYSQTEIDDPMEIDLVRNNESKSLAVINGQIQNKSFSIVCDSGSNVSVMPIECANEIGLEIDTKKIHNLSGFATDKKSIGVVYNVSITLAPECTIIEDFVIIEGHPNRELILSRTCLKRYNYDLLESREHLAITCDSKHYFIPMTLKK